jgi:hypothetical protein
VPSADLDRQFRLRNGRNRRFAQIAALAVWIVTVLAYLAHVLVGHVLGDTACEDPVGSSNYGHASWQWLPPGTRCSYSYANLAEYRPGLVVHAHTDRPSIWCAVVLAVLIIWLLATVLLVHRADRR